MRDSCEAVIGDAEFLFLWRLLGVTIGAGRVDLAWRVARSDQAMASIERRVAEGDWAGIGTAPIQADGLVQFTDPTVVPGSRYGYRAGLGGTDPAAWSEVAWVEVPLAAPARLAFGHPGTLVAHGPMDVTVLLPVRGTVQLDAFDLSGRRVAARSDPDLDAGPHTMRLAGAGALRSGIYFLRVTQAGQRATARALVFPGP